ncbi:MAG: hypothetical protein IIA12_08595 [Proteobacteria bacterium]|nr:hypothetical protein [Pseudomonadota bacterium]
MTWTRRKTIAVSLLALLFVAIVATSKFLDSLTSDGYAGQPQVLGLPTGFDPRAPAKPYSGLHPSRKDRRPDTYTYPIPIGQPGPILPTYADSLDYPFICRTEGSNLGQPLIDNQAGAGMAVYALDDAGNKTDEIVGYSKDCSLDSRVLYYYRSRKSGAFMPLKGESTDIDDVIIDSNNVPFVVRIEIGTINRHIYVIAMLRGQDDTPERPDLRYWNQKLIYQLRGGVGIGRRQGRISPNYLPSRRQVEIAKGYAVVHSTANQTLTSYDIELAEDTMARVKRQFSARYGEPEFMIGIGGSGGAIQQYLIGQNRPGLLDAGIAQYSYPDMITLTTRVMDCELLEYFFDVIDADNEKWQTWSQRSWILGFNARDDIPNDFERLRALQAIRLGRWPSWSDGQTECTRSWRTLVPLIANPQYTSFASLFSHDVAERVPFTYWDHMKRVYGTDEQGFGRRTYDNVGVQYGLEALKLQQITIDEFLKLNDSIGGWKSAAEMQPERFWNSGGAKSSLADVSVWSHHNMTADGSALRPAPRSEGDLEAIAAAYRSGQVFLGALEMPIIDFRHYLEPELNMHHSLPSFSARLRMMRHQGHADTQIIWSAAPPFSPTADALAVLEEWLTNMRDNQGMSVVAARPDTASDRCYASDGKLIASGKTVWDGIWNNRDSGVCMQAYPIYSDPRLVAGDDFAGDIFKCQLQSVDAAIAKGTYEPADVVAHRDELHRVFPNGVCDYSLGDVGRPDDVLSVAPNRNSPVNP